MIHWEKGSILNLLGYRIRISCILSLSWIVHVPMSVNGRSEKSERIKVKGARLCKGTHPLTITQHYTMKYTPTNTNILCFRYKFQKILVSCVEIFIISIDRGVVGVLSLTLTSLLLIWGGVILNLYINTRRERNYVNNVWRHPILIFLYLLQVYNTPHSDVLLIILQTLLRIDMEEKEGWVQWTLVLSWPSSFCVPFSCHLAFLLSF